MISKPAGATSLILGSTYYEYISIRADVTGMTEPGDYTFQVTVTNPGHPDLTAQVVCTVKPASTSPVVNSIAASPADLTLPASSTQLSADTSGSTNQPLRHWWAVKTVPAGAQPVFDHQGAATTTVSNLVLPGSYKFTLRVFDDLHMTTQDKTFTVAAAAGAPVITSAAMASVILGAPFMYTITADSGGTGLSATNLAPGLTVANGVISGTPTTAGMWNMLLSATNASGKGYGNLALTVNLPAPLITSPLSADRLVNQLFNYTIVAGNCPSTYGAAGLPPGFVLDSTSGVITGTPTIVGITNVTISATSTSGSDTRTLTLAFYASAPPVPVVTSPLAATGAVGAAFSYTIAAANNPTRFFAIGLPPGVKFDPSSPVIAGVPLTAGVFNVTLRAGNLSGNGSAVMTLVVNSSSGAPLILAPPTNLTVSLGQGASLSVLAVGAVPLFYQWRKDSTNLPGATGPTNAIGSAQAADAGGYAVVVSNGIGCVTSTIATLTVTDPDAPGWAYAKTITLNHAQVSGTHTDFPALVVIDDDHDVCAHARSDGADLLFTDTNRTPLSFELESYAAAGGAGGGARGVAWVRVPTLSAAADTNILLLYGNPGCNVSRQQPAQVWDSHYQGVWHLGLGAGGLSLADSTGKRAATPSGAPAGVAGRINGGVGFDDTAQYIDTKINMSGWTRMTIEGWASRGLTNRSTYVGYEVDSPPGRTGLRMVPGSVTAAAAGQEPVWAQNDAVTNHFLADVYDGTLPTPQFWLYFDGVSRALANYNAPASSLPTFTNSLKIGTRQDGTPQYSSGMVDEVRVSDIARSGGWIATEYNNQANPTNFATFGAEWRILTAHGTSVAWLQRFGLKDDTADDDADGAANWQESVAGTCPTADESVLRIVGVTLAGDSNCVLWLSDTNDGNLLPYAVQESTNLEAPGGWTWAATGLMRDPPTNKWFGSIGAMARFYRIVASNTPLGP